MNVKIAKYSTKSCSKEEARAKALSLETLASVVGGRHEKKDSENVSKQKRLNQIPRLNAI